MLDASEKNLPLSAKLLAAAPDPKALALISAGVLGLGAWASLDNLIWVLTGGIIPLQQAGKYQEVIEATTNARVILRTLYDNKIWRGIANIFTAGIWEKVYWRAKNRKELDKLNFIVTPRDWALYETSSWVNYYLKRDHSAVKLDIKEEVKS